MEGITASLPPWDLIAERCVLPVVFSHAAAVIVSTTFSILGVADAPTIAFFLLFAIASIAFIILGYQLQVHSADKAVVITGCDSGFGNLLARRLDKLGYTVFAGCLFHDSGGDGASELRESGSERLHVIQLDVTSDEQVVQAVTYVQANLPKGAKGVWAVVNNAGLSTFGQVEWVPLNVYRKIAEVNLFGTIKVTKAFLPLVRRAQGRVINVASILGRLAPSSRSPYCVTKFGVVGFTECLRKEMKRWGVHVGLIAPGNFVAGTALYSKDAVQQQGQKMWESMSEEVRATYGEDYFNSQINLMSGYTSGGLTDVTPVVTAMEDAVCRSFPLQAYYPMAPSEKVKMFVGTHFPTKVYDILYS